MRSDSRNRHICVFVDLSSGRLGWTEHAGSLVGDVVASGEYLSGIGLDALYESVTADESLTVEQGEWWNGDSIAASGPSDHPFIAKAA